jgi:DNA replicative helicase MCM subunit Mcm2 (Cdc46/Mcm family)
MRLMCPIDGIVTQKITAPVSDNQTWASCRTCGRDYEIPAVPGLLWVSVKECPRCLNRRDALLRKKKTRTP